MKNNKEKLSYPLGSGIRCIPNEKVILIIDVPNIH